MLLVLFLLKFVFLATADIKQEYYIIAMRCNVTEDDVIMTSRGVTYCGSLCLSHDDCSGFGYEQESGKCLLFEESSISDSTICSGNDADMLELFVEEKFAPSGNTSNNVVVTCENGGSYDSLQGKCVCQNGWIGVTCDHLAGDCSALKQTGEYTVDGIYTIHPSTAPNPFQVYCFIQGATGLTRVQVHHGDSYSFNKSWSDYKQGFTFSAVDAWLGNDNMHYLSTSHVQNFLLDIKNVTGSYQFILTSFMMGPESEKYKMSFSSTLSIPPDIFTPCWHPPYNIPFSTYDQDNDGDPEVNCAALHGAGWWFQSPNCTLCNLNGEIRSDEHIRQGNPSETFALPIDPDFSPDYVILALFWQ